MQHPAPAGPQDWWLRPHRPSDALVIAVGAWREATNGGKDYLAGLAVAFVVTVFWLLPNPKVALGAITLAAVCGVLLVGTTHLRGPQGWVTTKTAAAMTLLAVLVGLVLLHLGGWVWLASVWGFTAAEVLSRRPKPTAGKPLEDRWYSFRNLQNALITAGVLPKQIDGSLPNLEYKGKLRRDAVGEWQKVELPPAVTWDQAKAQHQRIAGALGLPAHRLHIEHSRDDPETWVTFAVLNERKALPAAPAIPERTDFTQPVPLGVSNLGKPVEYVTRMTHGFLVAKTRAGKSWLARRIATWALLDPRAAILVFSGKDPMEDWRPMRHLVAATPPGIEGYVGPIEDEAGIDRALTTLRFIREVVRYRGDQPPADRFPLFVVMDEWMLMVETARGLNKRKAEEMEREALMLAASASGLEVHLCVTAQRPTDDFLKSGFKANLGQILVGLTRKKDEVRYALGFVPTVLPAVPGEFLVSKDDSDPALVATGPLDDETWASVVIPRATSLRGDEPHPPLLPVVDAAVVEAEPVDEPDDLTRAVWDVLKRRGPMKASELYKALPPAEWRPGGDGPLGKKLARMTSVRERWEGNVKKWEYVAPPRRLPTALPPEEHPVPLEVPSSRGHLPPETGSGAAQTPSTGTDGAVPPVLRVLP